LTISTINKQMFPQVQINWISYAAPYPGAAPQEVEEGITIKIEEALKSVQGLKRVITYSNRNFSNGWFEVELDYDPQIVLEEVKSAIDSIASTHGKIDVLINNSGIGIFESVTDSDIENWNKVIDSNLKSVYLCSKAVLAPMLEQKSGQIINILSILFVK